MGEIRIVGPGKTRGYPYPVCKKIRCQPCQTDYIFSMPTHGSIRLRNVHIILYESIYATTVICQPLAIYLEVRYNYMEQYHDVFFENSRIYETYLFRSTDYCITLLI